MVSYVKCHNGTPDSIQLKLEPWGETFEIRAKSFLLLEIHGPNADGWEMEWIGEGMVVWPPSRSSVRVLSDTGKALGEETAPRPPTP